MKDVTVTPLGRDPADDSIDEAILRYINEEDPDPLATLAQTYVPSREDRETAERYRERISRTNGKLSDLDAAIKPA